MTFDWHDDGTGQLPTYTMDDLRLMDRFVRGQGHKDVLTTLEEYPLPGLTELQRYRGEDPLPPIVPNLYRSGAYKPEEHIANLMSGLRTGAIVHATVDADASYDAYVNRGIPGDRIVVIHNGIDIDTFKPSAENRAEIRNELGIGQKDPTVLFVGRDSHEKDPELFLKSARLYLDTNESAHAIMAGAGLDLNNAHIAGLIDEIFGDKPALKAHLHALGVRPDFPKLYNAGDVLALTSATESRPLCITEAQAAGLGVAVSTEVGDAPKMIGEHGFISSRDPEEIAALWAKAYKLRNKIGFPQSRREELGTARMIASYDEVIRDAVAQRRRSTH